MAISKRKIWRLLDGVLWLIITAGVTTLLVAAVRSNGNPPCSGLNIQLLSSNGNFFIEKGDVQKLVKDALKGDPEGKFIQDFDLRKLERQIEKGSWVKNAEVFLDNNHQLQVIVEERNPVARIFSTSGPSFYIDSTLRILPLSTRFSARVPVFTGYAGSLTYPSSKDSAMLTNIKVMADALAKDTFLMSMADQVDINTSNQFVIYPKVGEQVVLLGSAADLDEKFTKLKLFYKRVITKTGWNYYGLVDLTYRNQVIAKIRGREEVIADSVRAKQIMDFVAKRSAEMASDTTLTTEDVTERIPADLSVIQQSFEREDEGTDDTAIQIAIPTYPPAQPVPAATTPALVPSPVAPTKQATPAPAAKPKPAAKPTAPTEKPKPVAAPKPVVKTPGAKPATENKPKPAAEKPATNKPAQQPKIVMPDRKP